jgi:hypothetical protein
MQKVFFGPYGDRAPAAGNAMPCPFPSGPASRPSASPGTRDRARRPGPI